jgi:hypothetical protein
MTLRALGCLLAGAVVACSRDKPPPAPKPVAAPSVSVAPLAAPVASGLPSPELVSAEVNPDREPAYSGPVGTVRGKVVVKGDQAPELPDVIARIPATCPQARSVYGKLFREGEGRALADVLVAVTGYDGYVPERSPAQAVTAKDCSFGTRTLALTFGQRIEVSSGDLQTYIPELLGEHGQPQLVATPRNKTPSPLYPTRVGRFALIDNLKLFMTADVLVVKFATHAVTGLDGRFEITGVPVGQVKLNALLPVTGGGADRTVTVTADKPVDVELEIPFDLREYKKSIQPPAPTAAGSALPRGKAPPSGSVKPP